MTILVLASASPTRAGLLEAAGVAFAIVPARIDEEEIKRVLLGEGAQPREIAAALAKAKALHVSAGQRGAFVLGADQVLDLDGILESKSENIAEAGRQLRRLRGRSHVLASAAVLAKDGEVVWRYLDEARLLMRDFSEEFLENYLANEGDAVPRSVGGYRLEGLGIQLFEQVEGDYFSILGLPLVPVLTALRERGLLRS